MLQLDDPITSNTQENQMMTILRVSMVFLFFVLGCSEHRAGQTALPPRESQKSDKNPPPTLNGLIGQVTIGMSDSALLDRLGPASLDRGTIYWGGSGVKRMYFQIAPAKQIWFEIGGSYDGDKFGQVTRIGPIEPKARWTRHGGDSITVE